MLLFANYKTYSVAVDDKGKKHKAQGGKRVMYTQHHPCWDAKNRYGLPDEVDFDYSVIAGIISGSQAVAPAAPKPGQATQAPPVTEQAPAAEQSAPKEPAPVKQENSGQMAMDLSGGGSAQAPAATASPEAPKHGLDGRIPKALRDLMEAGNVSEWDIQEVVAARGYYPSDTPIWNYDPDFVAGVLVGAWEQVLSMIRQMWEKKEIPFN